MNPFNSMTGQVETRRNGSWPGLWMTQVLFCVKYQKIKNTKQEKANKAQKWNEEFAYKMHLIL